MDVQNKTRPAEPELKLEQAIHLAKSGQKTESAEMLRRIVAMQPVNQAAWLWLSAVTSNKAEAEAALARAKKINPDHHSLARAEQWLVHRFSSAAPTQHTPRVTTQSKAKPAPTPPVDRSGRNVWRVLNGLAFGAAIAAVVIGLIVLLVGLIVEINPIAQANNKDEPEPAVVEDAASLLRVQLDAAQKAQDWDKSAAILEQLRLLEPDSQALDTELANVYYKKGFALRNQELIDQALASFKRSLTVMPDQPAVSQQVDLARAYLSGAEHYQAGQWSEATFAFETVWTHDKTYPNVQDLLYSAYYNQALSQQAAGKLVEAQQALDAAITLRPDLSEPRRLMAEIEYAIAPETPAELPLPSVEDRLILVGLAEQRMHVYEDSKLLFDFIVSTGEPGRETAVGEFEILDKIDVAYASTWNLDMPYWMGIYWAGPLENGIHSLPIVRHTGYKLWDGYLGQRVSYGCVILSDEDAATLYDWTVVGTKVKIVPSLADWSPEEVGG